MHPIRTLLATALAAGTALSTAASPQKPTQPIEPPTTTLANGCYGCS